MLLTESQRKWFWNKKTGWPAILRAHNWTPSEGETQRKAMLARAGFTSLTLVDRVEGFTRVLKEMDALRDDVSGLMHHRQEANDQRVMDHTIRGYLKIIGGGYVESCPFGSSYLGALMIARFDHMQWDRLTPEEKEQMRFTLAARATAKRRKAESEGEPSAICHQPSAITSPALAESENPF